MYIIYIIYVWLHMYKLNSHDIFYISENRLFCEFVFVDFVLEKYNTHHTNTQRQTSKQVFPFLPLSKLSSLLI